MPNVPDTKTKRQDGRRQLMRRASVACAVLDHLPLFDPAARITEPLPRLVMIRRLRGQAVESEHIWFSLFIGSEASLSPLTSAC